MLQPFDVWFDKKHILKDITLSIKQNSITSIIGPSGGGKSTLIRSINRINDETSGFSHKGKISFEDTDIYSEQTMPHEIRKQIGMIFQKPCIFPKSIFENVLFGIRHHKKLNKRQSHEMVEENLKAVSLWKEVADRLSDKASTLSLWDNNNGYA